MSNYSSVFTPPNPVFTAGSGITFTSGNNSWGTVELNLPEDKNFIDLKSRIEKIEERLAILTPNTELQERFPALQEAYNHYKLIEKLVNDSNIK